MGGSGRPFGVSVLAARWVALAGALVLALLPLVAHGALGSTRLDWGSRADMPTPRSELGLAAAPNGKLYAVGGIGPDGSTTAVEEYDASTNTWATKTGSPFSPSAMTVAPDGTLYAIGGGGNLAVFDPSVGGGGTWQAKASMTVARPGLGLASAADGLLYAIGGLNFAGPCPTHVCDIVERYNPATNTWMPMSPLRTARWGLGVARASNGKIYAMGGSVPGNTAINVVEEYDPSTNIWVVKSHVMPTGRKFFGLAAAANGKLYAVGGMTNISTVLNTVDEYDPGTDSWVTKAATMPAPRTSLALTAAPNGKLYAIGGRASDGGPPLASVFEYDPSTDTWTVPQALSTTNFEGRYAPAVTTVNGKLYVFGGVNPTVSANTNTAFEYNPTTRTWTALATMTFGRSGAGAAYLAANNKIYVAGGYNGGSRNVVEEFTLPTAGTPLGSWRTVANLGAPRSFLGLAAGANGRLYAVGGATGSTVLYSVEEFNPAAGATGTWAPVASMTVPRDTLAVAVVTNGGQQTLYAVGGTNYNYGPTSASGPLITVNDVERLALPSSGHASGTWSAAAGLPATRAGLALVGASNGKLYALGGSITPVSAPTPVANVFEYDPAANAWSSGSANGQLIRPSVPTARFGLGAAVIGQEIFTVGGALTATGNGLSAFESAKLTELPSANAGGPYTVPSGGSVALSGSGADPEGGALSYAWDLDGTLLYRLPGQQATFSAVGIPGGTVRTVHFRALDPNGAYAVAHATITVTAPTKLAFATQPGGVAVGAPLSPQPVVRVEDPNGTLVPSYNGPVTVAFGTNAGGGNLGGTATVNAVNGIATFTDLFVSTPGNGYTLTASSSGLTSATSAPFSVTTPVACSPRPAVNVTTTRGAPGQLNAVIAARTNAVTASNSLASIKITQLTNATVLVDGAPVTAVNTAVPLPANTSQIALQVTRQAPGQASTVAFTVTDVCGEWKSFVGGGAGAF